MRRPFIRSVAVSLALCAMLLRGLMPAGWMPGGAHGASPFTICTADGARGSGKAPADPDHERSHAPCAFAAAAPLALPVLAAAALAAPTVHVRFDPRFAAIAVPVTPVRTGHAPRAPPAFS